MNVLFRSVDLETSDMGPPNGEVVEVGWTDIVFDTDTAECQIGEPQAELFKPFVPMKPENIAIHHITNEMVAGRPPCTKLDLKRIMGAGDPMCIVAHNWAFEHQWITHEILARDTPLWPICTMKAAPHVYPAATAHSNQALRYFLGLQLDDALAMPPHRAGPDSYVTAHVLAAMLKKHSVRQMVQWTAEPRFYPTCPLKKHRGEAWDVVPADYLQWVIRDKEIDDDLKFAARSELERRQAARAAANA